MLQKTIEYAKQLNRMKVSQSVIEESSRIFEVLPETSSQLADPMIPLEKRHEIIDSVFPAEVRDILKLLVDDNSVSSWQEIADEYQKLSNAEATTLRVKLRYVTKPTEEQLLKIKKFVTDRYQMNHTRFELEKDESLGGGFILEVGNDQYDWSTRGRREQFLQEIQNTRSSRAPARSG
mgnify:FL=1